jgi:hypothetical protein
MDIHLIYSKGAKAPDVHINNWVKSHLVLGSTIIIEYEDNPTGLNGTSFNIFGQHCMFSEETERLGYTSYDKRVHLTQNAQGELMNGDNLVSRIIVERGVFEDYGMGASHGAWRSNDEWVQTLVQMDDWWAEVENLFWCYAPEHALGKNIGNPSRALAEKLGLLNWTLGAPETIPAFKRALSMLQNLTGAPDAAILKLSSANMLQNMELFNNIEAMP